MRVRNSVAVVTGASSGIGRATALALAGKGANVVLAARGVEALEDAGRKCRARGGRALVVPADVADYESVEDVARRAEEEFGGIDVWVNAAALSLFGPFDEVPMTDFRRVVDVNLMGCVHGARAALPRMRERGRGVLVDVSSIVGAVAQPYTHAYGVTKFAIRGLGSSLRQELRIDGARDVHVCTVLPATIDTPLFRHAANHTGRGVRAMPPVYPPQSVARAIVNVVRVPRREVLVGPGSGLAAFSSRAAPGLTERVMGRQVNRRHLSRTRPAAASSGNLYQPEPGAGSVDGGWHGRRRTTVRRLAMAGALGGAAATVMIRRRR